MAAKASQHSVFESILEWSQSQPLWQRHALRLLMSCDLLSDAQIEECLLLCKSQHGLRAPEQPAPVARLLSENDIRRTETKGQPTRLKSLREVLFVNALAPNQILSFNESGLNVVYGDNASGKSGYARIIRKACRARYSGDPILPNVYEMEAASPATSFIDYSVGPTAHVHSWTDGQSSPPELSVVSFFDGQCANVHVGEKNDIAFTPLGLDMLERLASVCKSVQSKLNEDKKTIEGLIPNSLREARLRHDTVATKAIFDLTCTTDVASIEKLTTLNEVEQKRLLELRDALKNDPRKIAQQQRLHLTRIRSLLTIAKAAQCHLNDQSITTIEALADTAWSKREAARMAGMALFIKEPLPNVGSATWRQLWEAARKYSEAEAMPGQLFPVVEQNARCVLCQQRLDPEAIGRLGRFEQFVKDESQRLADESLQEFEDALEPIRKITLRHLEVSGPIGDLASESSQVAALARKSLILARLRRRAVFRAMKTRKWSAIPAAITVPIEEIEKVVTQIESRIKGLETELTPDMRTRLQAELRELEDRLWLATVMDDIKAEISRLSKLNSIAACVRDTITTSITTKSKNLAEEVVTTRLRDKFADEIHRLGVTHLRIELATAPGQYGSANYQVRLVAAPNVEVAAVVSEGEHRCIALAGFLAELATANVESAIVLDDPVCSLDHRWRENVACRLVEESATRQVIIFTHDIVFLHDLLDRANETGVPAHIQRVHRSASGIGAVADNLPWKTQTTLQRIDYLEKEQREAEQHHQAGDDDRYEKMVSDIYSELRATVERAIEECLFNRVVVRHRDYIDIKQLAKVGVLDDSDCTFLRTLHKRCCDITQAHDPSTGRNRSAPIADDVKKDISEFSGWVRGLRDRQKAIT
ncbi:MAG: AAA family ATPase [Thermoguttaceae bacterium]